MMQGWIHTIGIQLPNCGVQCRPQLQSRVPDRIAGAVSERPELEMRTQHRIALKIIDQISPASRTRCRSMNEHHRDFAWIIRLQANQLRGGAAEEIAMQKASIFTVPDLGIGQSGGKCDSWIRFQEN